MHGKPLGKPGQESGKPHGVTNGEARYLPGVETPVASARAARRTNTLTILALDTAERAFLLCRLADVSGTATAILARPGEDIRPAWGRHEIVGTLRDLVSDLRRRDVLFITSRIQRAALREAIEGNPYFVRMAEGDPRLEHRGIDRARRLRVKLAAAIGWPIGPVPIRPCERARTW